MNCQCKEPTIQPFVKKSGTTTNNKKKKDWTERMAYDQFYVPTHAKSKPIVQFSIWWMQEKSSEWQTKAEMFALAIIKMCIVNALIDMQNRALSEDCRVWSQLHGLKAYWNLSMHSIKIKALIQCWRRRLNIRFANKLFDRRYFISR